MNVASLAFRANNADIMGVSLNSRYIRAADVADIVEVVKIVLAGHPPSDSTWRDVWSDGCAQMLKALPPGRGIPLIEILTAPLVGLRSTTACSSAVRSIKHIASPIINLGNRSARKDNNNTKRHFKDHVTGLKI